MSTDIQLIPLSEEHLELVRNWRNSPDVAKYMYTEEQITSEGQRNWFSRISGDASQKHWVVSYDGKLVGVANIVSIRKAPYLSCSWAFYLGETSNRGAKIGSKVEYNILEYVFGELGLNRLNCEVFSFNDAVIRMHEKFGFRREAYYRRMIFKNDEYFDVVGLSMLKEEWEAMRGTMHKKIYGE